MSEVENFSEFEREIQPYKKVMSEAADIILDKEVSDFPIFIIHQHEVELGIPLANRDTVKGNWSVNASSLEEMVSKSVIEEAKIDSFKEAYKNPREHLCLFTLSELGAHFIYVPRNG